MEVYSDGVFKVPKNAFKNELGEMEFALPRPEFIPVLGNETENGENYFDRKNQLLYIGMDRKLLIAIINMGFNIPQY